MAMGQFVIDVCKSNDPDELAQLVGASKAYWTNPAKGYKLISNDDGRDFMSIFQSKIAGGAYDPGTPTQAFSGEVILVFERGL